MNCVGELRLPAATAGRPQRRGTDGGKTEGRANRAGAGSTDTLTAAAGNRAAGVWSPWTRLAGVAVLAAAMAHVEGVVVYYLSRFLPGGPWQEAGKGFTFPARFMAVERSREVATMVMLLAIGYLTGRTWQQKLAYYLFAFGCWDVCYYISLHLVLHWPRSLGDRDLLFLIPGQWWGPVWEPVGISFAFMTAAIIILRTTRRA